MTKLDQTKDIYEALTLAYHPAPRITHLPNYPPTHTTYVTHL